MARPRARPFRWIDVVLLAAFAGLGVYLAVETEREYASRSVDGMASPSLVLGRGIPGWFVDWKVGGALPHPPLRHGPRRAGPGAGRGDVYVPARRSPAGWHGAGHVLSVLLGCFAPVSFACSILREWLFSLKQVGSSPVPNAHPSPGVFSNVLLSWRSPLDSEIAWIILGTWAVLAATGRWKR